MEARKKRAPGHWLQLSKKLGSKPVQPQLALIKRVTQKSHLKVFKNRPLRGIDSKWKINYFTSYKAVVTTIWKDNQINRTVQPRCITRYPPGTWFYGCFCPFCRYQKFTSGLKPQKVWNAFTGHLLPHHKGLTPEICGELCWAAVQDNTEAVFGKPFTWPVFGSVSTGRGNYKPKSKNH